jgi:predicted porin
LNTLSIKYDVNSALQVGFFNQQAKSDALVASVATLTTATVATTSVFDRKTNGFAASYTVGATKFMANYQSVTNGDSATKRTTSVAGATAKVLGLGVDYSVSKRSTIYGRYEKDTESTGSGAAQAFRDTATPGYGATNSVYTALAIGLRHTF